MKDSGKDRILSMRNGIINLKKQRIISWKKVLKAIYILNTGHNCLTVRIPVMQLQLKTIICSGPPKSSTSTSA